MDFTKFRALGSLFSMLNQAVREIQNYNQQHSDFPMRVGWKNLFHLAVRKEKIISICSKEDKKYFNLQ